MKNLSLSEHLRQTVKRLQTGAPYQWTHQGRCNLGHLFQTVTGIEGAEIHRIALRTEGDWREHADTYCPTSGLPIDELIGSVLSLGGPSLAALCLASALGSSLGPSPFLTGAKLELDFGVCFLF